MMMSIIKDLWYRRRDLVSDGFDEALAYLAKLAPMKIHAIKSGTRCWTWVVPKKWWVKEAWIKNSRGETLLDLKNHPLHVVGSSLPVDKQVSHDELMKHLHVSAKQPDAIPWIFKYYDRDWGFCAAQDKLKNFNDSVYQVRIDSGDAPGSLKVGEITVPGQSKQIIFWWRTCVIRPRPTMTWPAWPCLLRS